MVGKCWLKSLLVIENAVVPVFCLLFLIFYRQINKYIVKLKHWKGKQNKSTASQQNIRIQTVFSLQLKRDRYYANGPYYFVDTPELTGKACAPFPDGRIDWEMTEEEDRKKKKTVWINVVILK